MEGFGGQPRYLVWLSTVLVVIVGSVAAILFAVVGSNSPDGPSRQEQRETIDAVRDGRAALSPGEVRVPRRLTVDVGEAVVLQVFVSPAAHRCDDARDLDESSTAGSLVGGYVRVVPRLDASGEIVPIGPEEQPVLAPGDCALWEFLVTPNTPGRHTAFVGVSTLHGVDDRVLETTTVRVSVESEPTLGYYLGRYGPVLLQVLGVLGALGIGVELWRRREPAQGRARGTYAGDQVDAALDGAVANYPPRLPSEDEWAGDRLRRWLTRADPEPVSLAESLAMQMDDGAWVDRAASDLAWTQPHDALIDQVVDRRRARDLVAAMQLTGEADEAVLLIEDVRDKVVRPWEAATGSVLLVIMDFLTATDATRIADQLTLRGLVEWVPATGERRGRRLVALPMLPPVRRGSLSEFLGEPLYASKAGGRTLTAAAVRPRRGSKRWFSPEALARLRSDTSVVHLVLSHYDSWTMDKPDRLAKMLTPRYVTWDLDWRPRLAEFLRIAAMSGRTVILTGNGGHLFSPRRSASTEKRWSARTLDKNSEVMVAGPRVSTSTGQVSLMWQTYGYPTNEWDDLSPGGFGGGSLAEIAVPILVFQNPGGTAPTTWRLADRQEPSWWAIES